MKKNKFRFTNRALVQLPVHDAASPSRSAEYSDADVIGLRVLVNKQGRKYFYFRFVFEGQKRAAKLGEFPALEVQDARKLALEMRAKVDRGINPQESHDPRRPRQRSRPSQRPNTCPSLVRLSEVLMMMNVAYVFKFTRDLVRGNYMIFRQGKFSSFMLT